MNYIFKHKLVQVPHPATKALVTIAVSAGQYYNESRYYRNALKTLTRKQRQAAIKSFKQRGIKYHA